MKVGDVVEFSDAWSNKWIKGTICAVAMKEADIYEVDVKGCIYYVPGDDLTKIDDISYKNAMKNLL